MARFIANPPLMPAKTVLREDDFMCSSHQRLPVVLSTIISRRKSV
jgi:hypothetical protein